MESLCSIIVAVSAAQKFIGGTIGYGKPSSEILVKNPKYRLR